MYILEILAVGLVGAIPGAQQGLQQQHGQKFALEGCPRVQTAQQQPGEPLGPGGHWL